MCMFPKGLAIILSIQIRYFYEPPNIWYRSRKKLIWYVVVSEMWLHNRVSLYIYFLLVSVPHDMSAGELDRMEKTRDRSSVKTIISSLLSTTETNAVNMPLWVPVRCLSSGGSRISEWEIFWQYFCRKLHEYEKNLIEVGGGVPSALLGPPLHQFQHKRM